MALFPIYRYRIFDDPFDRFFGDQLDLFDPWYDFDIFPSALSIRPNTFQWINEPHRLVHSLSHDGQSLDPIKRAAHSEKFRIQLNVAGFNPKAIKTQIDGRKLIVEAKQEDRQKDGDYNIQQIRKTFELPEHANAEHMTSYVTPNNILVIEVPIRNPETERRVAQAKKENQTVTQFGKYLDPFFDYVDFLSGSDFQPHIVDKGNNQKQLEMTIGMKSYRPEDIKVSVKNNELIVQGEHKYKDENRSERSFFYKLTRLPPGTQVDQLKSQLTDDGQLKIEAPFIEQQQEAAKPIDNNKK